MNRTFALGSAAIVLSAVSFAEKPDRWHDLVLNESGPADAIKVLGPAKKDETNRLRTNKIDKLLIDEHKKKVFRTLEFARVDGFKTVLLTFKEDKLIAIELAPDKDNKISTTDLNTLYDDTSFEKLVVVREQSDLIVKTISMEPSVFDLVGTASKSFVVVRISRSPSTVLVKHDGTSDDDSMKDVNRIQLVSRALEKPKTPNTAQ